MAICKHSKSGVCKACLEKEPYHTFKYCKKQCFACGECGYFYAQGAKEELRGKPVFFGTSGTHK